MYAALVTRIHTRKHPDADKLLIGTCGQYQVVVGTDTEDGQLGLFFESDGQLSEEFAAKNDLVRRKNEDGTPVGGMFEQNRRVKSIKLRGVKSEGFWCPLDKVSYTGVPMSQLVEGQQITELNGHPICNKYFTPATQRQGKSRYKEQRDNAMFHKHIDTGMFKRESASIPLGSTIVITEKLHGTSARIGHVIDSVPIKRSWLSEVFARLFWLPDSRREWRHLIGSRNVILEHRTGEGFYGEEAFRHKSAEGIKLHKGEVVYGELVGYTDTGKPIMATQDTKGLKDKNVKKQFGDTIEYAYGCVPGRCKFYVYRIANVNEDGIQTELSWNQVKHRCRELGLEAVPELFRLELSRDEHREMLSTIVATMTESPDGFPLPSTLDSRHIREGVVIRYESEHGTGWLKNKSFSFGLLEGYLKDSDSFVDTEESA